MTSSAFYRANLFIVAAPSGAGKSSLVKALIEKQPNLIHSISYTTRLPRPNETNGQEYHFISTTEFLARKDQHEFLEWAQVHDNYYGTSRRFITEQLAKGIDVILEIDWQGAKQIKIQFLDAIGIFILPPSIETLAERLKKRGQDSEEVIAKRLLAAGTEIMHANEFEYVIINTEFGVALSQLMAIVSANRCRFSQQAAKNTTLFQELGVPPP